MKKVFDELVKQTLNEFCKSISELTYQYVPKETGKPTEVPASHYKKLLQSTIEQAAEQQVQMQFVGIMLKQLEMLYEEEPILFTKALILLSLGIKMKDIGVKEQISLGLFTDKYNEIVSKHKNSKTDFYLANEELITAFNSILQNKELLGAVIGVAESEPEPQPNEPTDTSLKS